MPTSQIWKFAFTLVKGKCYKYYKELFVLTQVIFYYIKHEVTKAQGDLILRPKPYP